MKNIVSTKKTNAIFLAIVLVAGTIVLSSPTFMIGNVQAQGDYGMDNSYEPKPYENSYESDYENKLIAMTKNHMNQNHTKIAMKEIM